MEGGVKGKGGGEGRVNGLRMCQVDSHTFVNIHTRKYLDSNTEADVSSETRQAGES